MVKKVHIYLIFAITVVISLFVAGCKKEEVVYPPLLDEAQVLERLKEKYGEEFIIHKKTDLLSLGEVVRAPGPYSDIAEGIVYEASPENDPSFLFKVYTYRTYGNSSPIPFSKSGGVQADLEYRDCYGQDLLNRRFEEIADKYGIVSEAEYSGFTAYTYIDGKKNSVINKMDYHTWVDHYIYVNEKDIEEMAGKISHSLDELMKTHGYKEGGNFKSAIIIRVRVLNEEGKEKLTSFIVRVLFDKYGDEKFNIDREKILQDMKVAIEEEKGSLK